MQRSPGEVRLVYCLSIDLIESTLPGLLMTRAELDRFNRGLVTQIEPHLEALAFEDLHVKFTGDGWLLMSPEIRDAERLCALALIMRASFAVEMRIRTGLPEARIPFLRMAICSGRDMRVEIWKGDIDWVGDSARRATRSAAYCYPNEVLVDSTVYSLVMRDFVTERVDPGARPIRNHNRKAEEDIPLWSLLDLRSEAAEDWDAAGAYVYALGQLGRASEAAEASLRAAERLEGGLDGRMSANAYQWNRLLGTAPNYDAVLRLYSRMEDTGAQPNVDTLNILIDRSPTYQECHRWVALLRDKGISPNLLSYHTLIRRTTDFDAALRLVDEMVAGRIEPNATTLQHLAVKAPSYRSALGLLDRLPSIKPDLEVFRRLLARAPAYDHAVSLLEVMRRWGVSPDADIFNRLMAKAPSYEEGVAWLHKMEEVGVAPRTTSFNILIAKAARYGDAVRWLDEMKNRGVAADAATFNTLMARAPSYQVAQSLLQVMESHDVPANSEAFKVLIGQAPDYETAIGWLEEMRRRGVKPNSETFRELMVRAPDYPRALAWLEEMREQGVVPNSETFRTLMGRAPNYAVARALLDSMIDAGLRPSTETLKTLIAAAPDYDTAKGLVELLITGGMRPEADTYLPLILAAPDFQAARGWLTAMRERGVAPNAETVSALIRQAPTYEDAVKVFETNLAEANEATLKLLVEHSPDMATAMTWIDRMKEEGIRPGAAVLTGLLSRDPGDWSGDRLLGWYLGLDHHPSLPMQAAIESYRKSGRVGDALRLALDYPHLEAARVVFREHSHEALEYLERVLEREPGHPNGQYAIGLALLETGKVEQALSHLELARELAHPGPRVAALEEIIRGARKPRV
jgi:tetratricopeptide (TPR) repeat protein